MNRVILVATAGFFVIGAGCTDTTADTDATGTQSLELLHYTTLDGPCTAKGGGASCLVATVSSDGDAALLADAAKWTLVTTDGEDLMATRVQPTTDGAAGTAMILFDLAAAASPDRIILLGAASAVASFEPQAAVVRPDFSVLVLRATSATGTCGDGYGNGLWCHVVTVEVENDEGSRPLAISAADWSFESTCDDCFALADYGGPSTVEPGQAATFWLRLDSDGGRLRTVHLFAGSINERIDSVPAY